MTHRAAIAWTVGVELLWFVGAPTVMTVVSCALFTAWDGVMFPLAHVMAGAPIPPPAGILTETVVEVWLMMFGFACLFALPMTLYCRITENEWPWVKVYRSYRDGTFG